MKEDDPFDRLPKDLQTERLWLDTRGWQAFDPAKQTANPMLSWRREFLREFDETSVGKVRPLGALPVVVLASKPAGSEADCQARKSAADCLDFLSTDTTHIVAVGSGHEIHLYQPENVVKAVDLAISAVKTRKPLP